MAAMRAGVAQLHDMFPNEDVGRLQSLLREHHGHVGMAVDVLLSDEADLKLGSLPQPHPQHLDADDGAEEKGSASALDITSPLADDFSSCAFYVDRDRAASVRQERPSYESSESLSRTSSFSGVASRDSSDSDSQAGASGALSERKSESKRSRTLRFFQETFSRKHQPMATFQTSDGGESSLKRTDTGALQQSIDASVDKAKQIIGKSFSSEGKSADEESTRRKGRSRLNLASIIQAKVSKDRNRFVNDQFDLDLTYITPRIIAMAFPAEGLESAYRNSLADVADLLEVEHGRNYMVYNLSERSYDVSKLNHQVIEMGWPDHQSPPLKLLFILVMSIHSWLIGDPEHVVCIHCKGGKGRTGTVISSYFLYSGLCSDVSEAISIFGGRRMAEKQGVTQPSQIRYITYFNQIIRRQIKLHTNRLVLYRINLSGVPYPERKGGCKLFFHVFQGAHLAFQTASRSTKDAIAAYTASDGQLSFATDVLLKEDTMIKCHMYTSSGVSRVFRCQFFVGCIDSLVLRFRKADLDDACLDKRISSDFYVDLMFRIVDDSDASPPSHILHKYIPEEFQDGETCYFADTARNSRYMQQTST